MVMIRKVRRTNNVLFVQYRKYNVYMYIKTYIFVVPILSRRVMPVLNIHSYCIAYTRFTSAQHFGRLRWG